MKRPCLPSRVAVAALGSAVLALAGLAQPAHAANVWMGPIPITSVITNGAGGFLLLLNLSDPACGSSGNQFNVVVNVNGQTADGAKSALATVLTALALGKSVSVVVDDTQYGCPIQQVRIDQ